ncbi:hypothetical protein [Piscinibacter sp.]|uniref:hypothetical protein n=1 Tax=Piscinibacter sp. TaxID=1903157 RepID=UPI002C429CB0|nr:hypothetical protein [Albitalea sp.]HUG22581.1 hypothetical protein [Albitalea sp.]
MPTGPEPRRPRTGVRWLAGGAALALNALFLWFLAAGERGERVAATPAIRSFVRVLLPPAPVPVAAPPPRIDTPAPSRRLMQRPDRPQAERPVFTAPTVAPPPPVVDASPTPASAPLVIDAAAMSEAARGRPDSVGAMARGAGVTLNPERGADQALSSGVRQAARADCRSAHADKGLFAPLFLLHDAATDKGCKW